jgi:hypothetical protein
MSVLSVSNNFWTFQKVLTIRWTDAQGSFAQSAQEKDRPTTRDILWLKTSRESRGEEEEEEEAREFIRIHRIL